MHCLKTLVHVFYFTFLLHVLKRALTHLQMGKHELHSILLFSSDARTHFILNYTRAQLEQKHILLGEAHYIKNNI